LQIADRTALVVGEEVAVQSARHRERDGERKRALPRLAEGHEQGVQQRVRHDQRAARDQRHQVRGAERKLLFDQDAVAKLDERRLEQRADRQQQDALAERDEELHAGTLRPPKGLWQTLRRRIWLSCIILFQLLLRAFPVSVPVRSSRPSWPE